MGEELVVVPSAAAGFDFGLKNDPNMFACLTCFASSFAFSSSFCFCSASLALDDQQMTEAEQRLMDLRLPFCLFCFLGIRSFLLQARSFLLSSQPISGRIRRPRASSGVILDFFVGDALLLESFVTAVPSRLALEMETLGDCCLFSYIRPFSVTDSPPCVRAPAQSLHRPPPFDPPLAPCPLESNHAPRYHPALSRS